VAAVVNLEVYDVQGQKVAALLHNQYRTAGSHALQFSAAALASGVYLYRLEAGPSEEVRKMTLLK
jgi:hypothetical protein